MKYIITIVAIAISTLSFAQNLNWNKLESVQKNIVYLNFGYDFGVTTQLGYGHKLYAFKTILLTADYSFPMGKNLMDDHKLRVGAQMPIYEKNNLIFSGKLYATYKRHETSLVEMIGFGSELGVVAGYYQPTWFMAAEFGFDKSINTKLTHSDIFKENHPTVNDGWLTGGAGHFYYGIQGSKSLKEKFEISLKVGATNAEGKDENALLPYYAQLGLIYKFSSN